MKNIHCYCLFKISVVYEWYSVSAIVTDHFLNSNRMSHNDSETGNRGEIPHGTRSNRHNIHLTNLLRGGHLLLPYDNFRLNRLFSTDEKG